MDPELFPACVNAGAEMVELGNFDCFYDQVKCASKDSYVTRVLFSCSFLCVQVWPLSLTTFSSGLCQNAKVQHQQDRSVIHLSIFFPIAIFP